MQANLVGPSFAQETSAKPGSYILGTATTGGTYHPVGVALSTLIKLKLLPSYDIDLTAINTAGSLQNIDLLQGNDIQFGIVSALAGHDARTGSGQFAGSPPDETLRAITTLWLSTDHLLVRNESIETGTIEDFLDLRGRPVSLGREDSGTLLGNRMLMSALGVDIDSEFNLVELGYSDSAEALAEGTVDGISVSGGVPIAAVQDVFDRLGDKVSVLEISDEQLGIIDRGRGLWQRVVIPSGTYSGQSRDIFTIGTPNVLAVREDVDDEIVYQITKTIFEELDYLHGLHGATRQISLDTAVNNLPLPIHAGAARYFEEKGVELPPPPRQLDPDLLARYDSIDEARNAANQGVITLFAGSDGDTSTRAAAEFASLLDSSRDGIRLLANNGGGMGRNLTDLLYLRGVDAALVRADVLNYARNQDVYPAIDSQVAYISEMFPEEVHLLVRSETEGIADLNGKAVNIGTKGSGSEVTGSIILSQLGLTADVTHFRPRLAIEKLKQGEIDGAFFVGGKPMPLLQEIPSGSGLKLLSLPGVQYVDSYRSAEIRGADYPNLTFEDETVTTLAVRTALLTYAWRTDSSRYAAVEALSEALFQRLLDLQSDGYHPKWLEVDPMATFGEWRRFSPAAVWVDDNEGTARRIVSEARERLRDQTRADWNPGEAEGLSDGATGRDASLDAAVEGVGEDVVSPPDEDAVDAAQALPAEAEKASLQSDDGVRIVPAGPDDGIARVVKPASSSEPIRRRVESTTGVLRGQRPLTHGVNVPTF
jgi:TRAP transporter TAXI family solute receptor